uniref:Protein kinase domain-containing protein n=1 Tax=Panagrolaimus sp. PS1159 TaxID=55785 RepID=A0AC35EW19_9BILA
MGENYKILKKIGNGAFSEVFLAQYIPSNFPVALKKINMSELEEHEAKNVINEIQLLQKVNSKNVITYFGAFKIEADFYIALEFADIGDLEHLIKVKRTIWFYFHQICNGLKDLHAKRILHRDLKPANIFLNSNGHAKLGDLGLSRMFSLKTQLAKTVVGTEYYLAPERAFEGGYHFKSDIWSLGCILYELCALRSPFNGEQRNAYALHKRIEFCEMIPIPSNLYSKQLRFFISSYC